jgi:hypothetical protein
MARTHAQSSSRTRAHPHAPTRMHPPTHSPTQTLPHRIHSTTASRPSCNKAISVAADSWRILTAPLSSPAAPPPPFPPLRSPPPPPPSPTPPIASALQTYISTLPTAFSGCTHHHHRPGSKRWHLKPSLKWAWSSHEGKGGREGPRGISRQEIAIMQCLKKLCSGWGGIVYRLTVLARNEGTV